MPVPVRHHQRGAWLLTALLFLAVLMLPQQAPAQDAPLLNTVNGHYYEAVAVPAGITWPGAKAAAEARNFMGVNGHLATMTSASESQFVVTNLPAASSGRYFIGGIQPQGSAEPSGGWTWVTGEPWSYTNWNDGEPNNAGDENVLAFGDANGRWNDANGSNPLGGYVVEYEPPLPPAPATPVGLFAGSVSTTRVDLAWSPGSGGGIVAYYEIERKFGTVGYTLIASVNGTSYSDVNLRPGTTYTYRVRAVGDITANVSAYSDEAIGFTMALPTHPDGVIKVNLATNWLDYDPIGDKLYASMPSAAGDLGNTIVQINPENGAILGSVFVGSEPGMSAISDDGQFLYVFLGGSSQVRRVRLSSLTAEIQFPLGSDSLGAWQPEDLEVVPKQPHLLMATMYHPGYSPRSIGTAVYDDGVRRPNMSGWGNRHTCFSDGIRALIFHNETTAAGTWFATIDANGVNPAGGDSNLLHGFGIDGKFYDGLIYSNSSAAYDPIQNLILGSYTGGGGIPIVDSAVNRVYYLNGSDGSTTIRAYNQTTFVPLSSLPVSGVTGGPNCFNAVGTDGFAFRTPTQVVIVRTSLRPSAPPPPPTPTAPSGLTAGATSTSQIHLAWADNSNDESGFKIQRKTGNTAFAQIGSTGANVATFDDSGLQPNTFYMYRVLAFNGNGNSLPSNEATAATLRNPPNAPSNLMAVADGATKVNLTWTDGSADEDSFRLERAIGAGPFVLLGTVNANVTGYSDASAAPNTTYTYRVQALAGGSGSSFAVSAPVTTPPGPPDAPSNLTAEAKSSATVHLAWADGSGNETGFRVERSSDGTNFTEVGTTDANVTTSDDAGLSGGTKYYYRVRAYNAGGNSGYTNVATATTPPSPPGAPTNLKVTLTANTQASLTWTDTSNNEDSYLVERAANGGDFATRAILIANSTSYVDNNLVANTTYTYRVRAVIGEVNSEASNTASITTPPLPPAAPSGLTATAAGTSEVDLAWADGSANESGFHIERGTDGMNFTEVGTTGSNVKMFADQGLQPNTTYYYRVSAYNAGGASAYTNVAHATTAADLPSPPAVPGNLHAASVAQTGVSLAWTASAGADSYEVERKVPDGEYARVGTPTGPTFTDGGLQPNTSYTYRVRAVNTGGTSEYSSEVTVTTLPNAPGAPTNFRVTATTQGSVSLAWSAPAGPLTGYKLERSPDGNAWSQVAAPGAGDSAYTDHNLQAGTSYQYRLRASNAGGDSPYAGPLAAATQPNAPAAPLELKVVSASGTSIQLGWKDGSTNETAFVLERKVGAGEFSVLATLAANTTNYTDTNVTTGVVYAYRVNARNEGGESSYSNTEEALLPTGGKLTVSPANLNFGTVKRGKSSKKTVRVSNTGRAGDLTVTVGSLTAPFSVTGGGTFTLRPRQSQTMTVQFTPTGAGAVTGKLLITSNDPGARSVPVSLSGNSR